jgi:His/Glu/Gln/Arg/opine family amino acid ABC transporter permease subunit
MGYTFNWTIVFTYLPQFAQGLLLGLGITLLSLVIGSLIGLGGAAVSQAAGPPRLVVRGYVEVMRNVPILLWAYFAYYGLPQLGIGFLDNTWSFILALSLYAGAYLTEVFRAGLAAIPRRYGEAAMAIGLRRHQRIGLVTMPLMFRIVLPSLSNTFIGLFKDTSVAAALAVPEVTFIAQRVNQDTFRVIEAWSIAAIIYLVVGYVLAIGLRRVERRLQVVR